MDSPLTSQQLLPCETGVGQRGGINIALSAILVAAGVPAVLIRLYVRKFVVEALWWDDAALLLALVSLYLSI